MNRRMSRSRLACALFGVLMGIVSSGATAWEPPAPAATRKEFEAAYPKTEASAAALELEGLAAEIGIDIAPDDPSRAHPAAEDVAALQALVGAAGQFLDRELKRPDERIDPPSPALERYLSEREPEIDAIRTRILRREDLSWEMDVSRGSGVPSSNVLLGHARLYRVLAVRALLEARRKDPDAALQSLEAIWRLAESLASRPGVTSQLIVLHGARLAVGALRRVDAPSFLWVERLRSRDFLQAYLVAFQNDFWLFHPEARDLTDESAAVARIVRRFVESLPERTPCDWTLDRLRQAWEVALSGEPPNDQFIAEMVIPNLLGALARWHRLLLDSELTALVLVARAERAASRDHEWPAKLVSLESSVCPGQFWSYRRERNETATFAFEGHVPESEEKGIVLPLTFRAGIPPPTPTPRPLTRPTPRRRLPPS